MPSSFNSPKGLVDNDAVGGWPRTNNDILVALKKLHEVISTPQGGVEHGPQLDSQRIFLLGHGAGGYLALWACSNLEARDLPFKPAMCIAISPVCDLVEAVALK